MRVPIARQGAPYIAGSLVLVLVFGIWGNAAALALALLLAVFITAFFRDPERIPPDEKGVILAPADGRVLLVEPLTDREAEPGAGVKLGIFMSVFNCHVNRIPVTGVIMDRQYRAGRFFAAHRERAARQNEQNALRLQIEGGGEVQVIQIAGLIARRIVCWAEKGDRLRAGERFGLIQFGSRVDLHLPPGSRIIVKRGDRVKAGLSILGYRS